MSETKFSAGPWRATSYGVRNDGGYIFETKWPSRFQDQDDRYIEEMSQRRADVHLAAAAIDLYAALEKAYWLIGHALTEIERDELSELCGSALAKARGEQ